MIIRALGLPPDPLWLAGALAGRPGLAILASRPEGAPRAEDARYSFVACEPSEHSDALVPSGSASPERGWNGARPGPQWIGVIPYDAVRDAERSRPARFVDVGSPGLPAKPAWRRYPAVVRVDHASGQVCVEADDATSADRLVYALGQRGKGRGFSLGVQGADEPDEAHLARIRAALDFIAAGDVYEINLCRRIALALRGDAVALFASLLERAPAPWGYYQDFGDFLVFGASPELALSVRGNTLRTCPIKGTRPRGRDAQADRRAARELQMDPKEAAELVMAVDVHRNDLGRVSQVATVDVPGEPRVLAGRTVWSRVAEVVARRAAGVTLTDVARAVLPCGSVTGAPKVRAMELIAALEPWRRGVYTGAFGYVGRDRSLELAMAIRIVQAAAPEGPEGERRACYFAGGGIVADSDPHRELEETRWKAIQLMELGKSAQGPAGDWRSE